jgi:peptidoglycan-associated lipoprotein
MNRFKQLPTLLLLYISISISSCFLTKPVKTGEVFFHEKQYTLAADLLKEEIGAEKDDAIKAKKIFLIAESYRLSNQTIQAESYYRQAADANYEPIALYNYALMLKTNGKYAEALKQFQVYANNNPDDENSEREIKACKTAIEWIKKPLNYKVNNLDVINSPSFDYAPVLYEGGSLVFTSDRSEADGVSTYGWTGQKYSDFFIAAKKSNQTFTSPIPFNKTINSVFNEGAGCFNKALNEFYFTRCGADDADNDYCKIYFSFKDANGEWSEAQLINLFEDSVNVSQPFLTIDGKDLYFSADSRDGYGGKDIYVSSKNADGWNNPINIGATINTPGDEVFPYLADDGRLFFASNGQQSMGGLDVFYSKKISGKWSAPVNMQYPINSSADDFGLIFEKLNEGEKDSIRQKGFMCSSRLGGKGEDDIYQFIQPKIKVCMLDIATQEKILSDEENPNSTILGYRKLKNADVTLAALDANGSPLLSSIQNLRTDTNGKLVLIVDCEKFYKISVSKTNYFSKSDTASTIGFSKNDNDTTKAKSIIVLDKIFVDKQVNIPNIYYDLAKWNIRPDAAKVLDNIVLLLKENPTLKVELGSHTDSRADDNYNMTLSQKRAQSAVDYLVKNGIDKSRLVAKGYGETQLVNNCSNVVNCTDEEHQANRRTTFKVLKVD